jgi:putative NADH-flavin reductase
MKIALIGATGNIGSRVLDEALSRMHLVTAISLDADKLAAREGLIAKVADTHNPDGVVAALKGNDAIIVAIRWDQNDIGQVIDEVRASGVRRALFVVGAGSLMRQDGRLHFEFMVEKGVPVAIVTVAMQALDALKKVDDLDWTAISPSADIQPGERTGKFRLDLDHLIQDDQGLSSISREDFAIAILDEIERPQHIRRRFTAGY